MKKIFYSLMTVAALLTAASCQKEFTNSPDPAYGGKPVVTTFSVDLGVTTKASASTGLDDGTTVNKLYVAAFGSDGKLVSTSLVGNNAKSATGPSTQVSLTLSKGQAYDIVFFWVYDGAYDVNFADNNTATFSYKTSSLKANDPQLDAFYTKVSVASASTTTESVTLKRPFAQINVLSSNVPDGQTAFKSTMTVKAAPTTFDLFNGAVGSEKADLEFAEKAISEAAFGKYAQNYTWIGMNFVLPTSNGAVSVNFKESGMAAAINVDNVTVKKNTRTNLVGAIYDLDATINYTVTVNPIFENEGEAGLDDDDTEITVAGQTTYDANNPLVIDASNGANPVSVTLTVNGGDSFNTIETGADGGVIEASSDNEDVATAEVDKTNNAVKITPVGNGTANITVTTPRYTKAFSTGSITIPVQVTGFSAEAEDPTLTITGAPTAATAEPFTLTVDTNSDGEISWMVDPENAATVAAGTTTGEYVVTPATDLAENTKATVTFTVAATDAYNEASEAVEFTVAGEGGGSQEEGLTVTEIIALDDATEFTAKESLVVAKTLRGVIVSDGTSAILVFNWANNASSTANLAIGDKITFKGTKKTYNSVPEVDPVTDIEVVSSGNTVTYPTATDITSTFDSYAGTTAEFISFTGTIAISGNYTNINVDGATKVGSASYPTGDPALTNGQRALIKGYFNGFSGSNGKYVNIVVVSVESAGAVESSISVADMEVQVGKSKTVQATVNPTNAVVEYTTTSNKISISGNTITGVSEGTATVKANIAAVEGSYTASSTTFTVTVTAATGGDEDTATLTNDEITAAFAKTGVTKDTYGDFSISSESGSWTGNINTKEGLTFVQIRNKTNAHLLSPTFDKNIEKVELTVGRGGGDKIMSRKFFAIAANSDLSVFTGNYNANDTSTSWDALTKYGEASSTESTTDTQQTVTIEFTGNTKNFMLVTYNGAAYIDAITVYFK